MGGKVLGQCIQDLEQDWLIFDVKYSKHLSKAWLPRPRQYTEFWNKQTHEGSRKVNLHDCLADA